MLSAAAVLSQVLGVVYTAAWSISFYPQAILNFRRKSVDGLSIDYATLNPVGFAAYTIYNVALAFSPVVRHEYAARHDGHLPQVRWNDIAFAAHAFVISSITLIQTFVYSHSTMQRLSIFNTIFLTGLGAALIALIVVTASDQVPGGWLDVVYFFSFVKLYISLAKLVVQAWLNYKRQSTIGWSIENVLLDLTGGVLSLGQLVLDSAVSHDWSGITGNVGKLGLSVLAIGFDGLFMLQHFVLYRHAAQPSVVSADVRAEDERAPLLA